MSRLRQARFRFLQILPFWITFAFPTSMSRSIDLLNVLNFEADFGGIPNDPSACQRNTDLLSQVLQWNASHNVIQISPPPNASNTPMNTTYYFYPGIYARHVENTTILVDCTMRFERPNRTIVILGEQQQMNDVEDSHQPPACWMMDRSRNVVITSTSKNGRIDGRGSNYWGVPVIGYVKLGEHRPRLLRFNLTSHLLIEHITFQDSPYHTIYLQGVEDVTLRYISIVARRTPMDGHSFIDLSAFNTDGIDVGGTNIHVHDVDIWTQDDCIAVKDNQFPPYESTNMLFERVNCSGLGLVVGSIGRTLVRNITFRDSYLHRSVKGLYLKFHQYTPLDPFTNRTGGQITDVSFENIQMEGLLQWPIWIGPAQQSDDRRRPCKANPCSLCWPQDPYAKCHVVNESSFHNITFSNIHINNPIMSPGVLFGGIHNVNFDNVLVTQGLPLPISMVDRTITFPGLKQPIVDHHVPHKTKLLFRWTAVFLLILSTYLVVRVVLPLTAYWRKQSRGPDKWESSSARPVEMVYSTLHTAGQKRTLLRGRCRKSTVCVVIFLLVCTIFMIGMLERFSRKPKWNRHNHYFRCVGVVNGTAGNGTWPIPSCFGNYSAS